jgi:hypothetical protein
MNTLTTLLSGSRTLLAYLALVFIVCLSCSVAASETYFPPDPYSELGELDHNKYYTWGIDVTWDTTLEEIVSASLLIDELENWNDLPNDLYIHLLDDAPLGVTVYTDWQGGGDNFAGQGILLVHYEDLSSSPEDKLYVFTDDELDVLNDYALDGRIAFGLDPDCHFYNDGVAFTVDMRPVPEPATLAIVGLAGALLVLARKARKA